MKFNLVILLVVILVTLMQIVEAGPGPCWAGCAPTCVIGPEVCAACYIACLGMEVVM